MSAKAGAWAFTALEHLLSEVYDLQERWEAVNTVPENKLTQLITGWEICLSTARICFYGYSKQDDLDATTLGLEDLSNTHQKFLKDDLKDIIETTFNKMVELQVSSNKSEDIAGSPKVGNKSAGTPKGDDSAATPKLVGKEDVC